jgi:pimeloyl-ACP methyl ester carboxylesterase
MSRPALQVSGSGMPFPGTAGVFVTPFYRNGLFFMRSTSNHSSSPTFVLVHGSGSSSFIWASVQRELALLGHRSYAVDLPGHGLDA